MCITNSHVIYPSDWTKDEARLIGPDLLGQNILKQLV